MNDEINVDSVEQKFLQLIDSYATQALDTKNKEVQLEAPMINAFVSFAKNHRANVAEAGGDSFSALATKKAEKKSEKLASA